jgi:hypothetical protein
VDEIRWERYGAASGFVMVVSGAAASVFERVPVTAADFAANRTALLTQSMLFLTGAAVSLWFVGSLRIHLLRAEGGLGRLSAVAFGAGIAWSALNMLAQALQIGAARDATASAPTALLKIMSAVFAVANLPLAVMLAAVAVVSLRHHAFPRWSGWLSMAAAGAQALLWVAAVVETGPLASGGWLSFVLYPFFLIWLVPATVIMMKKAGQSRAADPDSPQGLIDADWQRTAG